MISDADTDFDMDESYENQIVSTNPQVIQDGIT